MAIDYVNLLGLILVAVAAPLVVDLLRVPVPDAVAMILIGIAVGGSGLGWIRVDGGVELLAALGLAYLLFVAGLEVRIDLLRGPALAAGLWAFLASAGLAVGLSLALYATGLIVNVGLIVATLLTTSLGIVVVVAIIATARGDERNAPAQSPADEIAMPISAAADSVAPPGLPTIGKWMISADGAIAHWLGEIYEGKLLREPINVILVDAAAASVDDAKQRLVEAAAAAGYPIRFGHSTGYRALIGGQIYAQLPAGRNDAFSNRIFELSNNHGRIFGPSIIDGAYVFIGAFSREEVRPLRWPEHGYASFNRARDDFSQDLDRTTQFKLSGFIDMANAIIGDPEITTGDHDRLAVLLRAGR